MKVLVTGGAGYIGSHVVYELLDRAMEVVVLDNLSTGSRRLVSSAARLVVGDVGDKPLVERLIESEHITAVLHFAGSIVVPESVRDPLKYYFNNAEKARVLLEVCAEKGVRHFVFSSTAAVYGDPTHLPVTEATPTKPINPYGRSKLMTEWMVEDVGRAHGMRSVILRYFNVAGADPAGRTGQLVPEATNLVKVACESALGRREVFEIFGDDYPTADGTCVRDFIHVSDLAAVHVSALDYLIDGGASCTLNCGYGKGYSVRQVVEAVKRLGGIDFPVRTAPRRPGDPPSVVADISQLLRHFDWHPRFQSLEQILSSALRWEERIVLEELEGQREPATGVLP